MSQPSALMTAIDDLMADPNAPAWARNAMTRVLKEQFTLADMLYLKPELIMQRAGKTPDPWQTEVLRCRGNLLVACSRQRGKSESAAAMALLHAIIKGPCTVLYTSRTLRQVAEFMRRVRAMYATLRTPVFAANAQGWDGAALMELDIQEKEEDFDWGSVPKKEYDEHWGSLPIEQNKSVFQLLLSNGSRIVGIPPKEETVRGFTDITLLILDEAARLPDDFYMQCGAYLLVRKGVMVAFTTPFGRRGWFWEVFDGPKRDDDSWKRMCITALGCQHTGRILGPDGMPLPMCDDCRKVSVVRLDKAWIEREKKRIGDRWFRQEYGVSFEAAAGAIFATEHIQRTRADELPGFDF